MDTQPKYARYARTVVRQNTFGPLWPRNLPVDSTNLVMNGLFYSGQSDRVICFSCGQGFQNITNHDSINAIHLKSSPHCAFLQRIHGNRSSIVLNANLLLVKCGKQCIYIIRLLSLEKDFRCNGL